jgi:hypothetical protein
MNEIEYTIKIKTTTGLPLDEMAIKGIATAITDGIDTNLDNDTIAEVTSLTATYTATIDCSAIEDSGEELPEVASY